MKLNLNLSCLNGVVEQRQNRIKMILLGEKLLKLLLVKLTTTIHIILLIVSDPNKISCLLFYLMYQSVVLLFHCLLAWFLELSISATAACICTLTLLQVSLSLTHTHHTHTQCFVQFAWGCIFRVSKSRSSREFFYFLIFYLLYWSSSVPDRRSVLPGAFVRSGIQFRML